MPKLIQLNHHEFHVFIEGFALQIFFVQLLLKFLLVYEIIELVSVLSILTFEHAVDILVKE